MGLKKKRCAGESSHLLEKHDVDDDHQKRMCFPLTDGQRFHDRYIRPLVAEFFGTLFLIYLGCLSSVGGSLLVTSIGHGLALVFIVVIFGPVSGALVNPAVTLGLALSGNMSGIKTVFYVLAQAAGAITGAGLVALTTDDISYASINGGVPALGMGVSILEGIFMEAILTFVLVLVVLLTAVDNASDLAPVAIGFALQTLILAGGPITGASLNPVRALGPAIIFTKDSSDHWDDHWVYWVGPLMGALVAAVLFRFILASPKKRTVCHDEHHDEELEHVTVGAAKIMGAE